ncbi:hypothetical protein [Microbacterium sp. SD291]|uniref:hypothetical protein n=1 Tax=Microbacterium sp. SD291 TaxID=2782007 RepID=UPI001A97824D|nr:hypothetical protein [Microbacterium sp. SD291]MBO0979743.1 hypothetical protein [Microbacterium sp. SD291]
MNTRTPSRLLLALPIAALAFSLAACGGAARPTADQVADGLTQFFDEQGMGDQIDADAAACLADHLVDSDLSDETLRYLADGEDKQSSVEDRDLTTQILQDNLAECTA